MNAIIVHGTCSRREYYSGQYPSLSNSHWLPWLQKQLLMRDIVAVTPEMPHAYKPDYEVWRREVERYEITPETLLVGHSCGGGFWVRWLSEHPGVRVGQVVLVAPWLDPNNIKHTTFFDFEIDPELVSRARGVTIFNSVTDHPGIHWSVEILRQTIPGLKYREFDDYGHFCSGDMPVGDAFPELLAELTKDDIIDI
jgi:predicted alpha/beta hydrolase family esterase